MSSRPRKVPSYRLHKPTGQAVVRLDGHDHYLGKHGTPASEEAYRRTLAEWLASGQGRAPACAAGQADAALTISEMLLAFLRRAEQHYRGPDGTPTRELANLR